MGGLFKDPLPVPLQEETWSLPDNLEDLEYVDCISDNPREHKGPLPVPLQEEARDLASTTDRALDDAEKLEWDIASNPSKISTNKEVEFWDLDDKKTNASPQVNENQRLHLYRVNLPHKDKK